MSVLKNTLSNTEGTSSTPLVNPASITVTLPAVNQPVAFTQYNQGNGTQATIVSRGTVNLTGVPADQSFFPIEQRWNVGVATTNPFQSGLATIKRNGIASISIGAAGSGYTSTPNLVFPASPTGDTATGYAVINAGIIQEVYCDYSGSGYASAPVPTLTGGGGTGAALTTTLGNFWEAELIVTPATPNTDANIQGTYECKLPGGSATSRVTRFCTAIIMLGQSNSTFEDWMNQDYTVAEATITPPAGTGLRCLRFDHRNDTTNNWVVSVPIWTPLTGARSWPHYMAPAFWGASNHDLCFISCGIGGTDITQHLPGALPVNFLFSPNTSSKNIYQRALSMIYNSGIGKPKNLFWFQGENDMGTAPATYQTHLQTIGNAFNTALGGNAKMMLCRIHQNGDPPGAPFTPINPNTAINNLLATNNAPFVRGPDFSAFVAGEENVGVPYSVHVKRVGAAQKYANLALRSILSGFLGRSSQITNETTSNLLFHFTLPQGRQDAGQNISADGLIAANTGDYSLKGSTLGRSALYLINSNNKRVPGPTFDGITRSDLMSLHNRAGATSKIPFVINQNSPSFTIALSLNNVQTQSNSKFLNFQGFGAGKLLQLSFSPGTGLRLETGGAGDVNSGRTVASSLSTVVTYNASTLTLSLYIPSDAGAAPVYSTTLSTALQFISLDATFLNTGSGGNQGTSGTIFDFQMLDKVWTLTDVQAYWEGIKAAGFLAA